MATDTHAEVPDTSGPQGNGAGSSRPDRLVKIRAWHINVRLLVWSLVALGLLAPTAYFWHRFQVRRHASAILERARKLYDEKEWRTAAATFHQYQQLRPDAPEASEVLLLRARAFDKQAVDRTQLVRATSLYSQALQLQENREKHDVRLRLAELLYATGRYDEAAVQVGRVLDALPDEIEALRLRAAALRAQLGAARSQGTSAEQVVDAFEEGLAKKPGDVSLTIGLAEVLRKHRDGLRPAARETAISKADGCIDKMIEKNPADSAALLARYRYRLAWRIPAAANAWANADAKNKPQAKETLDEEKLAAEKDLADARELARADPDVLLASAIAAAESERILGAVHERDAARADALDYLERFLEVARDSSEDENRQKSLLRRGYLTLASLHARWNDPNQAIVALRTGLKQKEIGAEDLELNRTLLQMQVFAGNAADAAQTLARIEPVFRRVGPYLAVPVRSRFSEDLEVARAQLDLLQGNTIAALPRLKRMAASVTEGDDPKETAAERVRRWRMLGSAYARAGMHDLAASAYSELLRLEPTSQEYRLLAAGAWRLAGDIDRAIRDFETVTSGKPEVPGAWLVLAEARLDQQLRRPAGEIRDWRGIDAALKKARVSFGDAPEIVLLQAMLAIVRNQRQTAVDDLKLLADDKDLDPGLLPRIAALLQSAGESDAADAALDRFVETGGEPGAVAVAKSDVLRRRGDAPAAIKALEQALLTVPEAQRTALLRRIITLEIDAGSMLSARNRLSKLRKVTSRELWVYETAADLALLSGERGDLADLKDCEGELHDLEGDNGSVWRYFQAIRLLASDKEPQEAAREASKLLNEIEALRPNWPQILVLRGRIAQQRGAVDLAAESFEQALRAGARGMTTYNWLVSTLYKQSRFGDAASYIQQGGQIASLSGDLASQAVPLNLRAGNIKDALRVAQAAAEFRPTDTLAQLWYGQTLAIADRSKDAEEVFLKAIALDATKKDPAKNIQARSALIWFYSRERRPVDARKALDELVDQVKMTSRERELVLARGSELIGDRQLAMQHFQQALAEGKKDAKLYEEVGKFYMRFDHDKALDMYQQALEANPKSAEARRAVALLLSLRGSPADLGKAMALLENGEDSSGKSTVIDDRRLQATLLLMRGGAENAAKAVALLGEVLDAKDQSRPLDRVMLARAYEGQDNIDEAKAQFETVLQDNETPAYLVMYIDFLNRHEMLEEVGKALVRLEEKDPYHARLLELRVDWLNRSDRAGEIEETVDRALAPRIEAARKDEVKVALLRYAAELFTRAKLYDAAEKRLREVAALLPAGYEALALWLAQRERYDEALALCLEKMTGADLSRETSALVRVLTLAAVKSESPTPEPPAARKALDNSLASEKITVQLLLETGVLRVMQGRDADAVALYQQALKKEPGNVVVLNNLAVLLAEVPDRAEEAVTLIDKAVAAVPNSLELLDSKALVLIGAGRFAEARNILDRICNTEKKNSRYRLHLAVALFHLNEPGQAREEAEQAVKDGLEKELLTPGERRHLKEITGT